MQRPMLSASNKASTIEKKVLHLLTLILDFLIFLLIVALLIFIFKEVFILFSGIGGNFEIKKKIETMLYALILVELFTILFFYLKEHRIKVDRIIEVGIISLVRDVIFKFNDMDVERLFALGAILLVLGVLFFIEKYFSKTRMKAEDKIV